MYCFFNFYFFNVFLYKNTVKTPLQTATGFFHLLKMNSLCMEENRVKHTQGSGSGGYYFLLFSKFPELTSILLEGQCNSINTCNDKKNKGHRMTFEFYKTLP